MFALCIFFFKKKTAYEMLISDWSSDVCSSDLSWNRSRAAPPSVASIPRRTRRCRQILQSGEAGKDAKRNQDRASTNRLTKVTGALRVDRAARQRHCAWSDSCPLLRSQEIGRAQV